MSFAVPILRGSSSSSTSSVGTAGDADYLSLEAGENLLRGDPVYVSANKFYKADNVTNANVVGIVVTDTLATFLASAVTSGQVIMAGLVAGGVYFLGNLLISTAVPTTGKVVRVGTAITSTLFLVNIEEPILLAV